MKQLEKVVVWSLIGVVFLLFWISLRSDDQAIEYSIAALVVWGITYGVQYLFKRYS